MKRLEHLSDQWVMVANRLPLPGSITNSIQVSRLPDDHASLRKVVEWWFKNTPNPDWDTIQEVLQGNFHNTFMMCGTVCFITFARGLMYCSGKLLME